MGTSIIKSLGQLRLQGSLGHLQWVVLLVSFKLIRLGLSNQIAGDSDFKAADYGPIRNPIRIRIYDRDFDIKIDLFWSKFDIFRLKDRFIDHKVWLKDPKSQLKDHKLN